MHFTAAIHNIIHLLYKGFGASELSPGPINHIAYYMASIRYTVIVYPNSSFTFTDAVFLPSALKITLAQCTLRIIQRWQKIHGLKSKWLTEVDLWELSFAKIILTYN